MSPVMLDHSCDGEYYGGGENRQWSYGFFLDFLSLSIGFGMKNHQASIANTIDQPAIMTQLQSPAISIL